MPAARLFWILALATVLVVAGVVVPTLGRAVLAFDALLLVAYLVDLHRARRVRFEADRSWHGLLVQGAETEVTVTLRIERPGGGSGKPAALHLQLREALDPALVPTPLRTSLQATLEAGPGGASGEVAWRYRITPRRRGEHSWPSLMVRVRGPWGLAWHQRSLLADTRCRVYPQVRWDGKVGHLLLLAHRRSLGRHPQNLQGAGTEPYALREYLPGDPPNRIQWKASARHGRLVSREDTWERGARLVVLLDCARSMSGRDGVRSKLDHALAASLALVRVAAARGDRVTLAAFSDRIERTLRVHGGQRSVQAAYGQLYDLEARRVEPAFDLAAERAVDLESRRSTVVLLTSVVDLAAAELLRRAVVRLERRHRPILVNLEDPELVATAEGRPASPADAFAKAAALEIQLANRRLGTRLRHAGVRVVSTSADRLALETLEAYLAMFGADRRTSRRRIVA